MREIKFRAWHKEEKVVGEVKMLDWNYPDGYTDFYLDIKNNKNFNHLHAQEQEIDLMQYTGLKDKNGVEIYEGDIARLETQTNGTVIGEVKFECGTFIFACNEIEDAYLTFIEIGELSGFEVIGNIYKNPELLKGE